MLPLPALSSPGCTSAPSQCSPVYILKRPRTVIFLYVLNGFFPYNGMNAIRIENAKKKKNIFIYYHSEEMLCLNLIFADE